MENSLHATSSLRTIEVLPGSYCIDRQMYDDDPFSPPSPLKSGAEMAIHRDISACLSAAKKSLPRGGDLTEMLTHIVTHLLRHYDKDRQYYRISVQQMLFIPKDTDSPLVTLQSEQIGFVAYVIELAKMKKKVSGDINALQVATTIFMLYLGILVSFISDRKMTVKDGVHLFSSAISLLHRGIRREKEKKTGHTNCF